MANEDTARTAAATPAPGAGVAPGLRLERRGAAGIAVLDAPGHENAITRPMLAALAAWYPSLARDPGVYAVVLRSGVPGIFSRDGDVRVLAALAASDAEVARAFLAERYALCWLHECFSKPTVALIDGDITGAGMGLTLYGTHRVAGDRYVMRSDQATIGWVPDCGIAHAFARMPQALGLFLALSGTSVGPSDALALGLVTHCIAAPAFPAIEDHLTAADPVDPLLDEPHRPPAAGPILQSAARIARYFDAASVAETMRRLSTPPADDAAWAAGQLQALRARSPLALCLTHRAIREAAGLDIRETLIQDFRLASRLLAGADFRVGAAPRTAAGTPAWQFARVEDVPEDLVASYFAPAPAGDLQLASRTAMQAARV